jgi:hypothetical protein
MFGNLSGGKPAFPTLEAFLVDSEIQAMGFLEFTVKERV